MLKNQATLILLFLCLVPCMVLSQEITIFTVTDFDLEGEVKSCSVSTDYGKEEYHFDESKRLTKAITRFSIEDYDVTLYKYGNNELVEKRVESFRGKVLDKATSIANFYTYDSTNNRKVTEKIITYEKEFLEQYEYSYTIENRLSKIIRTNNEGIDETSVVYYKDGDGDGMNYILNRELLRSVKTISKPVSDSTRTKTVTTKLFQDGIPNTTEEKVFDVNGKLSLLTRSSYDRSVEKFVPEKSINNTYDATGALVKAETKKGRDVSIKKFIYQYDSKANWIKQIVTPENSYKTREIAYYEIEEAAKGEN